MKELDKGIRTRHQKTSLGQPDNSQFTELTFNVMKRKASINGPQNNVQNKQDKIPLNKAVPKDKKIVKKVSKNKKTKRQNRKGILPKAINKIKTRTTNNIQIQQPLKSFKNHSTQSIKIFPQRKTPAKNQPKQLNLVKTENHVPQILNNTNGKSSLNKISNKNGQIQKVTSNQNQQKKATGTKKIEENNKTSKIDTKNNKNAQKVQSSPSKPSKKTTITNRMPSQMDFIKQQPAQKEQVQQHVTQISTKKSKPAKKGPVFPTKKFQQLSPQDQKQIQNFIEYAIKLRKCKNQKQFLECYSRIVQFIQQSWQYGDLSKKIKVLPRQQDIVQIGIQISRGIRKKLQSQQQIATGQPQAV